MDINDKELFDGTLTDQVEVETVAADEPAQETTETQGQPRDENGRFAAKAAEQPVEEQPAVEPPAQQANQQPEATVPSWRLREVNEAREAAERRLTEAQSQWQRRIAELEARLPKPEAPKPPDLYEDPNAFVDHGVRQAVDPVKSEITAMREFYSRKDAIREHGQDKVQAAYNAIAQGMQNRDPEVMAVYQRAMSGMDPFGDIVSWHEQKSVYQTIGNDPNKWWESQLEERMKDAAFRGKVLSQIQQSTSNGAQQTQNKIELPPSLNRIGSGASQAEDNDDSDAALFAHATR